MMARIKKSILIITGFLFGCLAVEAASLWDSLFEASGYKQVPPPTKPIVELPIPLPLGRYATQQEQTIANEHRFHALGYKHASDIKQSTKKEQQALLRFHAASQYGEPTSCTLLADFYRTGRYGLGPDEKRARMYEANIQWWEPPRASKTAAEALPAADDDDTDDTLPLDGDAARRASGDSDQSSSTITATGAPVSELRHRKSNPLA